MSLLELQEETTIFKQTFFVDVIIPLYLPKLYTYRVPEIFEAELAIGKRVVIQFGSKRVYSAIIEKIHHKVPTYEAKYIQSVIDDEPLIDAKQLEFWHWMASYYMCTLGEVMNAALPAGLKMESESRIILRPGININYSDLSDKEYMIVEALELQKELTLKLVSDILEIKNVYQVIKSLFAKEIIYIKEELLRSYKPKIVDGIKLSSVYAQEETLQVLFAQLEKKAPKQLDCILQFLHLQQQTKQVLKSNLIKESASSSVVNSLVEKGIFDIYQITEERIKSSVEDEVETFSLNDEQEAVWQEASIALGYGELPATHEVALLHGVTSSGKTHIYVKLIEEVLKQQKQVLYLLPEIALTGQLVKRLRKYFGNQIMVSHSKFNENERVEIWNKLTAKKVNIIIGARSAIFLPFQNLGLIIVDEEHETSYKQQDPAPRYHARDSAMMLARIHQAKTILGSATPSIETYWLALQGKYKLLKLLNRFGGVEMPQIEMADIAYEKKVNLFKYNFTSQLLKEMETTIAAGHQVILFQNRRGFVPIIECESCGWVPKCKRCDISLTYHKYNQTLKCHYCGYKEEATQTCHACGSPQVNMRGFGTEKVEEDLGILLPDVRKARLDLETTRSKTGHQKVISDLEEKRVDVLIGTQMVSKGLDFENVTLVGIMNADQLLHFPDFRAHERSFQMLSQVSGRAGRRNLQGKVIIQTTVPNHPVLQYVKAHQYEAYYMIEEEQRKKFRYPPFYRLIRLMVKCKDIHVVDEAANKLALAIKGKIGNRLQGPEPPYPSKIQDYYQRQMLIKIEREGVSIKELKNIITQEVIACVSIYKNVMIIPDVDPY
jgi:primosomal protein N' (replication factor Y)